MTTYGVLLFHTTSAAFRAEGILRRSGLSVKLIPVPREFSSDCGVAARFHWADRDRVIEILDQQNATIAKIAELP